MENTTGFFEKFLKEESRALETVLFDTSYYQFPEYHKWPYIKYSSGNIASVMKVELDVCDLYKDFNINHIISTFNWRLMRWVLCYVSAIGKRNLDDERWKWTLKEEFREYINRKYKGYKTLEYQGGTSWFIEGGCPIGQIKATTRSLNDAQLG